MEDLEIDKYNPTKAELTKMAEASKGIDCTDIHDKKQIEAVSEARIGLKNARVDVTKDFKVFRDKANRFSKFVISKEKELLAIIEPEETRLKELEAGITEKLIREERDKVLPERIEQIKEADDKFEIDVDVILGMDDIAFEAYVAQRKADKNQRIVDELNAEKERVEKAEIEKARRKKERESEKNRKADIAEAEVRGKEEAESKAREDMDRARQKEVRENEAKDREQKAEKKKLENRKAYVAWRASLGWTEETKADYKIEQTPEGYELLKRLGVFKM